ncbi:MAG: hypothetical protein U0N15_03660 [Bifidobacterium choerinum]
MTDNNIDLTAAAAELANLEERKTAIEQRISTLKASILQHAADGKYEAGDLTLTVSAGTRSLDPTRFAAEFPVEQYPQYYELKPKALSKIEKIEGSARIAGVVRQGARRVSVK